jgi:hypothetical protein
MIAHLALILVLLLVSLTGCGADQTLTGVVGSQRIEGEVAFRPGAALAADVEVRVLGTGIVTTTDSRGRFVLNGVPSGELTVRFIRDDGVDERVEINTPLKRRMIVALRTPASETASAAPSITGDERIVLSGVITLREPAALTIDTWNGVSFRLPVDASTPIASGGRRIPAEALRVGDNIEVSGLALGVTTISPVQITKLDAGHPPVIIRGTIASLSQQQMIVQTPLLGDVTLALGFRKGEPSAIAGLGPGSTVRVEGRALDPASLTVDRIVAE